LDRRIYCGTTHFKMTTYIILLRGINVGGHKKVPMAELREVLTKSGLENVKTYIQSGNVVCDYKKIDNSELEVIIKNAIAAHFDFEVPVFVRTPLQLKAIFDACPFPQEEKMNSYFTLLQETPVPELVDEVSKKTYPNEKFEIIEDCIYFFSSTGYGRAKYSNNFFEKKLKVSATARNYKTMMKLLEMTGIKQ